MISFILVTFFAEKASNFFKKSAERKNYLEKRYQQVLNLYSLSIFRALVSICSKNIPEGKRSCFLGEAELRTICGPKTNITNLKNIKKEKIFQSHIQVLIEKQSVS